MKPRVCMTAADSAQFTFIYSFSLKKEEVIKHHGNPPKWNEWVIRPDSQECFNLPVKCRWEKRCWMKCVSAEKSRSCSLSTLMRTAVLMSSRPLRSAQNASTSPAGPKKSLFWCFYKIFASTTEVCFVHEQARHSVTNGRARPNTANFGLHVFLHLYRTVFGCSQ